MTDDETFTAICADFPFDRARLEGLHARLNALLGKAQNRPPGDGTIDATAWYRLRKLTWAMRDLVEAVKCIEEDGDPFDGDIPF